jgi:hypothetical protein
MIKPMLAMYLIILIELQYRTIFIYCRNDSAAKLLMALLVRANIYDNMIGLAFTIVFNLLMPFVSLVLHPMLLQE